MEQDKPHTALGLIPELAGSRGKAPGGCRPHRRLGGPAPLRRLGRRELGGLGQVPLEAPGESRGSPSGPGSPRGAADSAMPQTAEV